MWNAWLYDERVIMQETRVVGPRIVRKVVMGNKWQYSKSFSMSNGEKVKYYGEAKDMKEASIKHLEEAWRRGTNRKRRRRRPHSAVSGTRERTERRETERRSRHNEGCSTPLRQRRSTKAFTTSASAIGTTSRKLSDHRP